MQENRSKEELTEEIQLLQKRIAEFEKSDSQRNQAEEALRASEELVKALVENISLGITYIDRDYKIVFANKAQGELFKRTPAAFAGKHCFSEFEKRDAVCPHCPGKIAMASGHKEVVEATGVRDDGSKLRVRINAFPFFQNDGKTAGFIEVVEDITEREKMEEDAQKRIEELEVFYKASVGREERILELKKEIERLKKQQLA